MLMNLVAQEWSSAHDPKLDFKGIIWVLNICDLFCRRTLKGFSTTLSSMKQSLRRHKSEDKNLISAAAGQANCTVMNDVKHQ